MNSVIEKAMNLLGTRMKDRVTGLSGMVTPEAKDNKLAEGTWFDVKRLLPDGGRIMPLPDYSGIEFGAEHGPETKSAPRAP